MGRQLRIKLKTGRHRPFSLHVNILVNTIMRTGFVAFLGVLLAVAKTTVADLTGNSNPSPSVDKREIPAWQFYYGVDSAQHQTNFNKWIAAGYRMISLSAYGQPPNNIYAAVWVQRSGVAWQAIHEASGATYQSWFDTQSAAGYVSTLITATGSGSGAVFAGVMEKISVSNWYQKCDLTTEQYETELSNAQGNRYTLRSFTEYSTASNRRYCGIWHANPTFDKYTAWVDESYSDYQLTFNDEVMKAWRPYYVTVSEDHLITSAFTDTDIGFWVARHGMTASGLQAEYETQEAAGHYLINLQGGGTGGDAQYTGIWADREIPAPPMSLREFPSAIIAALSFVLLLAPGQFVS
ncbi:hypothetical protein FGG08_005417 [Glutinoglossum americanum]|uniref:Uncharacterized protein n=1 Tax=Glutinoglossum americanum TaxID=1670608 RepID=A0A9P8HYF9_9PEZI|nr:hypothetical protein FGG08_005417 [Glutinoglossum americanum]